MQSQSGIIRGTHEAGGRSARTGVLSAESCDEPRTREARALRYIHVLVAVRDGA